MFYVGSLKMLTWFVEDAANILCIMRIIVYDLSCFLDANLILFINVFLSKLTEEDVE